MNKKKTIEKRTIQKLLNTYDIQLAALNCYNEYFTFIKFIYINNGIVPIESLKILYPNFSFYNILEAVKLLGLISVKNDLVILDNRAIQLIEDKTNVKNISAITDITKLNKPYELDNLYERCNALACVLSLVDLDIDIVLNRIIYYKHPRDLEYVYASSKRMFPNKNTMTSSKNSYSKILINSNIYYLSTNKYYIYIQEDTSEKVIAELDVKIRFLVQNFINPIIYTNIDNYSFIQDACEKSSFNSNYIFSTNEVQDIICKSFNELVIDIQYRLSVEDVLTNVVINNTELDLYDKDRNIGIIFTEIDVGKAYIERVKVHYYSLRNKDNFEEICRDVLSILK